MKNKIQHFDPKDFEAVKNIALNFPGAEESISHEGTPSVKVRGKLMCRLHDSGEFIPIRLDFEIRDHYLERYPEIFHLPDHFKPYPYICMWINHYDKKLLKEILELSWKGLATKKQISEYEAEKKNNNV
ncbi:MmcQ/YjbR family DNA-binding protein [Chryseobacterium taeanense]|uniref:MmcQ/YjbR family DNA-binding protein n=1 Tax=Chryseobacterium taeanense TaxID=311334 RepID=UPI0035B246BA